MRRFATWHATAGSMFVRTIFDCVQAGLRWAPVHHPEVKMANLKARLYHFLPLLIVAVGVIVDTESSWRSI